MEVRKKYGLRDSLNSTLPRKIIIAIICATIIGSCGWVMSTLAKMPEIYETKQECQDEQVKNQTARDRLEKRACDRMARLEGEASETRKDIKKILIGIGNIEGKLDK